MITGEQAEPTPKIESTKTSISEELEPEVKRGLRYTILVVLLLTTIALILHYIGGS